MDLPMSAVLSSTPPPTNCADCGLQWPEQRFARGRCKTCYGRLIKKLRTKGQFTPVETTRPLADRLFEKTAAGPGACVIFTGHLNNNGYGTIATGGRHGKQLYAHRAAYTLLVGPIPDGLVLDHLCRVRRCINPHHLEPVTQEENVRRASVERTHCPQGHEFTRDNTRQRPGRGRECRTCNRERARRRTAAQAGGAR